MEQNFEQRLPTERERERGNFPKDVHWRCGAQHFLFLEFQAFNHCSSGQTWAQRATVNHWLDMEEQIRALQDKLSSLQLLNKLANWLGAIWYYHGPESQCQLCSQRSASVALPCLFLPFLSIFTVLSDKALQFSQNGHFKRLDWCWYFFLCFCP